MTLSVCMIARNEQSVIAEALDSIKPCEPDEIVVVLAGESTDKTEQIAKSHGAEIYFWPPPDGKWPKDENGKELRHYGDARNACAEKATGDYILWIDADEKLVSGHELIRAIVAQGVMPGIRPVIHIDKTDEGGPNNVMARQTLLYKRGSVTWKGAFHEYTEGMIAPIMEQIAYEEIMRPEGDHSHGDAFELLRKNLSDSFNQRDLFYLAREHATSQNWQECVAVSKLMLDMGGKWPEQRSQVACFMAQSLMALGNWYEARKAWLRAIEEFGGWAEPYYGLAVVCRDNGHYQEGIAWAMASLAFAPTSEFANMEIYNWRRYDALAYCLVQTGGYEEAIPYYRIVMQQHPSDATRKNLSICERKAAA